MTFFPGTGTVLMYSGGFTGPVHVYSWNGSDWRTCRSPAAHRSPRSRAGSPWNLRNVVVLLVYDANRIFDPQAKLEHWEFDGRTWTQRDVRTPPLRSLVQTVADERDHMEWQRLARRLTDPVLIAEPGPPARRPRPRRLRGQVQRGLPKDLVDRHDRNDLQLLTQVGRHVFQVDLVPQGDQDPADLGPVRAGREVPEPTKPA